MFWLGLENGLEFRLTLDIYSQEASESKLDRKWGLRDVPLNRISFLCTDNGHESLRFIRQYIFTPLVSL